ncbi:hypothetical protein JCM17960_00170 [Magnetospira thiophila]
MKQFTKSRTGSLAAALLLAGVMLASAGADAKTRGLSVEVKERGGDTVALYAESHALLIGVSDYNNGWPRLRGVKEDIPAVRTALEKQGFDVTVVMDPDRDGLDRAFRNFVSRHGQNPANRLLFYFAGHGHSMKLGYGGQMGYLVGLDAPNPRLDKIGFKNKALSMQVIETYARNIESKHALFVFDSCFSGSVFEATRAIPDAIQMKTGQPVRQFITSGTADQKVPDRSVFRSQFVAALEGEGDLDNDGYVTGAELGQFLETTVTNYTRRSQTPQYGKLRDPLLDKGDFVFALPGAGKSAPATSAKQVTNSMTPEMMFWQSIQSSKQASDYEAYLSQYPNGSFAALARSRAAQYKPQQVASLPPEPQPAPRPSYRVQVMDETLYAVKTANVRSEPSATSDKLGLLDAGRPVGVTGRTEVSGATWYRVALANGEAGYVYGSLLGEREPLPIAPIGPAAPVRTGNLSPGNTFRDCENALVATAGQSVPSGVFCGPEMVVIPSGSFQMGSNGGDGDEKPVHRVNIGYQFAVGKYEVTQAEWQAVMGSNPSYFKGSNRPVEKVSWEDAQTFIEKLNRKTGQRYRLLSESEWEYVARAGTTTTYSWGNSAGSGNANCADCGSRWDNKETAPVGSFRANPFGVYDMHGNVWEWVQDCKDSYANTPADGSARGGNNSCYRVDRGGSWYSGPRGLRSAYRSGNPPGYRNSYLGFRLARTL